MKNFNYYFGTLILLFFSLNSVNSFSQNNLYNFNEILNSENSDFVLVKDLIHNIHPTIYLENQQVKHYGDGKIVKAEVYPDSYSLLQDINSQYNSVEVLIFKNDEGFLPNIAFDIAKFKSFESLKYIYLNCTSNCSQSQIQQMFTNAENVKIIYNFISSAE